MRMKDARSGVKEKAKDVINTGGTMKKILLGLVVGLGVVGSAQALTTDSVVLTVTPVFNLSVNISSAAHTFGILQLRSSATICVGQMENDGNVTAGWQKSTANTTASGGSLWTLTTGSPALDTFKLLAISTGVDVSPSFSGTAADSCMTGDHSTSNVTTSMTDLTEGGAESPKHPTTETRKLWVSILMPTDVTSGLEQTITLSVRAVVK